MKTSTSKIRLTITAAAFFVLFLLCHLQSFGQATRTWVSGTGDDANPCSRTAPCHTFAGAISKTQVGGEISVLDPGRFGALNITKSITINGDENKAFIATGITINAPADAVVVIRNISIDGTGANGIVWNSGNELRVENSTIEGFSAIGINIKLTTAGSFSARNTTIGAGGINSTGIKINTTNGKIAASLNDVRLVNLSTGLDILTGAAVTIRDSLIAHATQIGVNVQSGGIISVENCVIANNGTGVSATAGTIRLFNNQIFNNTIGMSSSNNGVIASFLNNKIAGNGVQGVPTAYMTKQ